MDSSFRTGFEKYALLGFAAKTGFKAAKMIGKGLTGIGKTFVKKPLGTAFGGLEVLNVASKTKNFSNASPRITSPGF